MSIYVSEAASCEHTGAYGYEGAAHTAGNQTGVELRTREYSDFPWTYVLRCTNKDIREAAARRCYIASQNMNIGYSQPDRLGVKKQLEKGIDICDIKEKVDCDCSSLVSGVFWYTFKTQNITTTITGEEYTKTMYNAFMSSGWFQDMTADVDLKSGEGLVMGDVLLTPGKHTAIVYSVNEGLSKTPKYTAEAAQYLWVYADPDKKTRCEVPALGAGNKVDVCDETADGRFYYIRISGKYYGYVEKTLRKLG